MTKLGRVGGVMALLLAGCSLLPERPPRPAIHDFGPNPQGAGSAIAVDAPEWLQDDRIRYRLLYDDPTQIRYYTLDRWVAPPALLLARRLDSLDGAGLKLRVQLLEFEQRFVAPGRAHVLVGVRVTALLPGQQQPVSQQFFLERPTGSADAAGAVTAFAQLADECARRIDGLLSGWGRR